MYKHNRKVTNNNIIETLETLTWQSADEIIQIPARAHTKQYFTKKDYYVISTLLIVDNEFKTMIFSIKYLFNYSMFNEKEMVRINYADGKENSANIKKKQATGKLAVKVYNPANREGHNFTSAQISSRTGVKFAQSTCRISQQILLSIICPT